MVNIVFNFIDFYCISDQDYSFHLNISQKNYVASLTFCLLEWLLLGVGGVFLWFCFIFYLLLICCFYFSDFISDVKLQKYLKDNVFQCFSFLLEHFTKAIIDIILIPLYFHIYFF